MSVVKRIITNNSGTPVSAEFGALASNVDYDNDSSGLQSTKVQSAIDELAEQNIEFIGTTAEWEALTQEQKAKYEGKIVLITDD